MNERAGRADFAPAELAERQRVLASASRAVALIALPTLLVIAAMQPEISARSVTAIVWVGLLALVAPRIGRAGHVRVGGMLLFGGLALLITVLALMAGGIRAPGVGGLLMLSVMAGLLLGERAALATSLISISIAMGLAVAETAGVITPPLTYSPIVIALLTSMWIALTVSMQRFTSGTVTRALQRAERKIEQRDAAERRLQLALEAGGIGVFEKEVGAGHFVGDPRSFDLYGLPHLPGFALTVDRWVSLLHPEDARGMVDVVRQLETEIDSATRTFRVVRDDGTMRHLSASATVERGPDGSRRRLVGVTIDVTERFEHEEERDRLVSALTERVKELGVLHRAARLMQRSRGLTKETLRDLVDALPAGWLHADVCAARITYRDQVLTTPGWRATPWVQSANFGIAGSKGMIEVAYLEERPAQDEGPFLAEERAVLTSLVEMLNAQVERSLVDENRRSIEEQLRHSQKMQALGTLAGGISHDFNNILTAINMNASLVLEDARLDPQNRQYVKELAKAADRAKDLVRRILLFSKKQEVAREAIHAKEIVEETVALLRTNAGKEIEVRVEVDRGLPPVLGDGTQLHQVLMNLGTNACHAMRERGGQLMICATTEQVGADALTARDASLRSGQYVRISVTDTGVGMPPEIRNRVFEPFFSTKGEGGTGLGLSVVHGIIRDHEGAITVESTVGVGTTFHVLLPVAPSGTSRPTPESLMVTGAGERIAFVDDDDAIVFVMTRIMERLGYRVEAFTDPLEALQALRERPHDFDAMITDVSMPSMSGLELVREVRQIVPDLRIAISTGYQDEMAEGRALGVHTFLQKPATLGRISQALAELVGDHPSSGA